MTHADKGSVPRRPVRAASYCRLSLAIMGDTTKVDDQDAINHKAAERRGWVIPPELVFKDNSRSAWQRDRKRPAWDAMLAAIERGEVDAIVVYHGDRLVRQPRDLEDLFDLAAEKGIRLAAPTGEYNLDDPDHQMMLRWISSRAKNESDHISRRQKRGHERRREQGIVRAGGRGGRAFGFDTDGLTQRKAEIDLMRECATRLLAGEGAGAIARDWNERGLPSVTGGDWQHGTLKKMMLRPRVAGLMPDGESVAAWPPVLDDDPAAARELWEAVRAVLLGRAAGFTYTTNAREHLLSNLAVCGPCENPVAIRHNSKRRNMVGYGCNTPGCRRTHRKQEHLDSYVIGHVLELLGSPGLVAELQAPADEGLATELASLEARKAETEQTLRNLVDHPSVTPGLLVASIAGFDERIAAVRGRIAMTARRRLLLEHAGISEGEWHDLPLATRRALVRASYRVTIWPVTKKGPGFEEETVILERVTEE
jgi:DNA invertase Pin-like site-specific DNA recombinase